MELNNINSDEFDTMIELIITIMFMAFGIYAMTLMVRNMSARVEIYDKPDKIEVNAATHDVEDPFWFTPYQAYMFSWHMDEFSYEPLSYVCGDYPTDYDINGNNLTSVQKLDVSSKNQYTVTLSVIDETTGAVRNQFTTWRNHHITGQGTAEAQNRNVKKSINSLIPPSGSKKDVLNYYRGKTVLYHLELTDYFTVNEDLNTSGDANVNLNIGGKKFKWVLTPRYHY